MYSSQEVNHSFYHTNLISLLMASQSDCKDAELYRALMDKKKSEVLRLYIQFPDGAFHRLTIHDDTVLHMALHSSQVELVLELLGQMPAADLGKIRTAKNTAGNTLLHEAATNDGLVAAAKEIIRLNPSALFEVNEKFGERALFRAARYGQVNVVLNILINFTDFLLTLTWQRR